jgi:hypothetical protein
MTTMNNVTININGCDLSKEVIVQKIEEAFDNLNKPSLVNEYQIFNFEGVACVVNVPFTVEGACIVNLCLYVDDGTRGHRVYSGIKMDTNSAKRRKVNSKRFYPEIPVGGEATCRRIVADAIRNADMQKYSKEFDYSGFDFDLIPMEYTWVATNADGVVVVYTHQPVPDSCNDSAFWCFGKKRCLSDTLPHREPQWRRSAEKIVRKTKVFEIDISNEDRRYKWATADQDGSVHLWQVEPRAGYKKWFSRNCDDYRNYIGSTSMLCKNHARTLTRIDWKN